MKFQSKYFLTRRSTGAFLGASALLALAGCGGGSDNDGNGGGTGTSNNTENASLTSVNLTALTSQNQLLTFNSRTPGTSTTVSISGLTAGDTLRAIDFRFPAASTAPAPPITDSNGNNSLFAIGQNGNSQQLYSLSVSGTTATATAVGARFTLIPAGTAATSFGFDFNPTVDRIRLVEPTSNRDLRLNPNTGTIADGDPVAAGVQPDGPLTYDASDANTSQDPDVVGAAYLNPDADATTGTTLFVVDAARNTLAIQGRANDPTTTADETISPNSGRLFTVGNLGIDLSEDSGFDISPTGNAGFLSNGNRIYGVSVSGFSRGVVSGGARLRVPTGARIIGLAATS